MCFCLLTVLAWFAVLVYTDGSLSCHQGIEREDRAKQQAMLAKQKELQDNIRMFLMERKAWREVERQKAEEELRKITEYNLIQEERHRRMSAQKQKAADEQDEVLKKLTKEIETKRREEDEMRALLDELYQEEKEQKYFFSFYLFI